MKIVLDRRQNRTASKLGESSNTIRYTVFRFVIVCSQFDKVPVLFHYFFLFESKYILTHHIERMWFHRIETLNGAGYRSLSVSVSKYSYRFAVRRLFVSFVRLSHFGFYVISS